jgi:hypothetical protein
MHPIMCERAAVVRWPLLAAKRSWKFWLPWKLWYPPVARIFHVSQILHADPRSPGSSGNGEEEGATGISGADGPPVRKPSLVADADTQAAEALALALDLDDLDPADLAGRGHVRAAVRLLV